MRELLIKSGIALKVLVALTLCGFLAYVFLLPTEESTLGTYTSASDPTIIAVLKDGNFIQYYGRKEVSRGQWKLSRDYGIFTSITLVGSYYLPLTEDNGRFGKGAMSYPLVHRSFNLCLEVVQTPQYWCK